MPRPTAAQPLALVLSLLAFLPPSPAAAEEEEPLDIARYMQGRMVYEKNCVFCHGRRGRGDGPWAEGVKDHPRDFRSGVFKFRSTPVGFLPTDDDLRRTVRTGVSGTMMPAFSKLTDADLDAVLLYIKNLSPRWKKPELKTKATPLPDAPDWFDDEAGLASHAAAGQALFAATCSPCHGPAGKGDGPAAKGLKDVWGHPVAPADLSAGTFKSGPHRRDLYRTVALGLDGTPMVGFKDTLKPAQLWDLVAYIGTLKTTPKPE